MVLRNVLFWWVILWPVAVIAQGYKKVTHPAPVYKMLKENSGKVNTITADFTEIRYASYLKEPRKSSGSFYYAKKDKMRWEQKQPVSYVILIEGNRLRISEEGKEKNTRVIGNLAGTIRQMLLMMVNGDFQESNDFERELLQNEVGYLIVMRPLEKRLRQRYEKLELQFEKRKLSLSQLTFFEKGGDKQVMTFHNEKINPKIPAALFTAF